MGRSGKVLRNMTVVSLMHSHSAGSPLATSFSLSGLSLTSTCILSSLPAPPLPPLTASGPPTLSHCTNSSPPIAPIALSLPPLSSYPSSPTPPEPGEDGWSRKSKAAALSSRWRIGGVRRRPWSKCCARFLGTCGGR
uniref:Uncharacterized protein n=1 Tax=Arundo donax TaxID=35708 RepID=A0A0A9D1A3_ARUDO